MFQRRPHPGEDEDDLLEFQAKFLASGEKPSAKIIKSQISNSSRSDGADPSHEDRRNRGKSVEIKLTKTQDNKKGEKEDMMEEMNKYDTHITTVLSNIIKERDVKDRQVLYPSARMFANPQAFHRKFQKSNALKRPSTSIFAQQFKRDDSVETNLDKNKHQMSNSATANVESVCKEKLQQIHPGTSLITGKGLSSHDATSQTIHEENIEKISRMSEAEIIHERDKLKASLDPKILEFLTKKKQVASTLTEVETIDEIREMNINEGNMMKVDQRCLHMDHVEKEKMKWLENIPLDKKNPKINLPNRFDFDGQLLSNEESIKIARHVGLHHHGSDQDLAGYTLQELISLSRSAFMQQRVFSLRLLSKIIDKDKSNEYLDKLPHRVTTLLLDAGIAFILRWALDEHSTICIKASVDALCSLITPHRAQEIYLNEYFMSHRGCEFPCFKPMKTNKENNEETDAELTSRDLIGGFIKMNILPRLRYILEVCSPDNHVTINCLKILIRISQHSTQTAVNVLECPRLINFITNTYLPTQWTVYDNGNVPLTLSVKLIRLICQSGRHAASRMIHGHVKHFMLKFVAQVGGVHHQGSGVEEAELEIWKLWVVCMSYGLVLDVFRDILPTLILQMQSCATYTRKPCKPNTLRWIQHLLKFVSVSLTNVTTNRGEGRSDVEGHTGLQWFEVAAFFPLVKSLLRDCISKLSPPPKNCHMKEGFLGVISCGLDIIASYCNTTINSTKSVETYNEIEVEIVPFIIKLLQYEVVEEVQEMQEIFEIHTSNNSPSHLPDLSIGSLSSEQQEKLQTSLLKQRFFCSFLRCSVSVCKLNREACKQFIKFLLSWKDLNKMSTTPGFLNRLHSHSIYWIVKLFLITLMEDSDLKSVVHFYHSMALMCFSSLIHGDEYYAQDLLTNVLFHKDLMIDCEEPDNAACDVTKQLCNIHSTYNCFITTTPLRLMQSKCWSLGIAREISTFLLPLDTGAMLPNDWIFFPLINLYDVTIQQGETCNQESAMHILHNTRNCLRFILALEMWRQDYSNHINVTAKLVRLMCVYMTGSDMFLDGFVQNLMKSLFEIYCGAELNFNLPIPGIVSFYDFYMSLLDQYDAVSYGDALFSAVILLPLQQNCDKQLKLALWCDHKEAIQSIRLDMNQILVQHECYLHPREVHCDVILAYISALSHGFCQRSRSPFLYQLAIHHITTFMQTAPVDDTQRVSACVKQIKDATIRRHLAL